MDDADKARFGAQRRTLQGHRPSHAVASKHRSQLYDAGLLSMEKKGTQVIYTLAAPCLVDMARCGHEAVVQQKRTRLA